MIYTEEQQAILEHGVGSDTPAWDLTKLFLLVDPDYALECWSAYGNLKFLDVVNGWPAPVWWCTNCDGRKCMGCVFREMSHDCEDDCPECCPYEDTTLAIMEFRHKTLRDSWEITDEEKSILRGEN